MPADMVVEPEIPCYLVVNDGGFGISEQVRISNYKEVTSQGIPAPDRKEKILKIKPSNIFEQKLPN